MPAFKYDALDASGKSQQGLLEADTAKAARTQLRAQGLVPMDVKPVAAPAGKQSRFARRAFKAAGLTVWTRQLAGLVSAGLPLERSLSALADEAEDPRQRELMSQLKSEVNAGSSFARALAIAPREFDDVYRAVVAAGEQSGALGPVLESLADDLEEQQRLRSELFGALAYPVIVCIIAVLVLASYREWGQVGEAVFGFSVAGRPWIVAFTEATKWATVVLTGLSGWLYLWRNRRIYLNDM